MGSEAVLIRRWRGSRSYTWAPAPSFGFLLQELSELPSLLLFSSSWLSKSRTRLSIAEIASCAIAVFLASRRARSWSAMLDLSLSFVVRWWSFSSFMSLIWVPWMMFFHLEHNGGSPCSACSDVLIVRPRGVTLFLSEALVNCRWELCLACFSSVPGAPTMYM